MTACGSELVGAALNAGTATGTLLVLDAPLSFWGGSDLATGRIIDERHPQRGACMSGRILVMHSGRGSSSSSSVLAEQIRSGVSPAAILLSEADAIIVLGTIVAAELYDKHMPVVQLTRCEIDALTDGAAVDVVATAAGDAIVRVSEPVRRRTTAPAAPAGRPPSR